MINLLKQYQKICSLALLTIIISCNISKENDGFREENIQSYIQKIESGRLNHETWTETPLSIVNKLFPHQVRSEGNDHYHIELKKEQINTATVIVTEEGMLDDSVYGEKRVISFIMKNNQWEIVKVKVGFRCQKNRGHESYSGESCS